jgi:NAD(P)-dependent dehydrogenase (short-subunit alcohol dehydrogenase family)
MSQKTLSILITGATSGIGRFTALHLARLGHRVFATGRNAEALATLAREAEGTKLETLRLDVTSAESIAQVKAEVEQRTEGYGLDVLVNNAGYGIPAPAEMTTDADLRAQYDTNVFGLMAMTRAFVPQMRQRGRGRVINVSSVGGLVTMPLFGGYNSTKFAVESLSDALRMELRLFGVEVSLIEPGVIATGFADRSMSEVSRYQDPESPYAPIMARAEELRKMTDRIAADPIVIARAITHAATARRPRPRYVAPFSSALFIGFLRLIPTRWADALLKLGVGITRRRLAAPAPAARLAA